MNRWATLSSDAIFIRLPGAYSGVIKGQGSLKVIKGYLQIIKASFSVKNLEVIRIIRFIRVIRVSYRVLQHKIICI